MSDFGPFSGEINKQISARGLEAMALSFEALKKRVETLEVEVQEAHRVNSIALSGAARTICDLMDRVKSLEAVAKIREGK